MAISQAGGAQSRAAESKPIGDDNIRQVYVSFQQFPQELEVGLSIVPNLQDDIDNLDLIIESASETMVFGADTDEEVVQTPAIRGTWLNRADPRGAGPAQLEHPAAYRLVGGIDTALHEQIPDIAVAEREPEIEPDGVLDYLGREAMAGVRNSALTDPYRAKLAGITRLR